MYITNRVATATVLLAGLVPLVTLALVVSDERIDAERAFRGALEDAAQEYQLKRNLPKYRSYLERRTQETRTALMATMREKRALRLQMAALKGEIETVQQRFALGSTDKSDLEAMLQDHTEEIAGLLRYVSLRATDAAAGDFFFRRMVVASLGDVTEDDLLQEQARGALTAFSVVLQKSAELDALRVQHEALLATAQEQSTEEVRVLKALDSTERQIANIQQTVQEVHEQVIRMQSALARIDAQIRARVERELLEKGLLTPGSIDRSAMRATPQFAWPAYGPIPAGFKDPSYEEHFGIPHLGTDIAIDQGSPVFSAAEGVAFLAHDGGATGYSYVLVGHRGGYATLYGHLSQISVMSGQDLRQGELIGLSGGAIGAHGSGPTTTGPHLHFEVIRSGENVNPLSVLPR